VRTRQRLRAAATGYLPVVLTIATLAPLAGIHHLGAGIVMLGAAVCLTNRPAPANTAPGRGPWRHAVAIIATTIGVAVLALAFSRSLYLGDGLYVSVLLGARLAGLLGPRWAALGRALLLPLSALFLAPPTLVPGGLLAHFGWSLVACLVASVWIVAIPLVVPEPEARCTEVARAARALATGRHRRAKRLTVSVAALDAALARAGNGDARAALLRVQVAAESAAAGYGAADDVAAATRELADLIASGSSRPRSSHRSQDQLVTRPVDPTDGPSVRARTRLALASALGIVLALIGGQLLFPEHWPWTVITVIAVSLAAASRGEVLVRSGQRLLGALVATAVISPLAGALGPHKAATVAAILVVLALGFYLREYSRIWWTAALTSMLALAAALTGPLDDPLRLLGIRLLAICVGGACAIVPALLLAPTSRSVLRKRAAVCVRRLGTCLDEPSVPAQRRFDVALADLAAAEQTVRLLRHGAPERSWYVRLVQASPELRASVATGEPAPPGLRRLLRDVAAEVRQPASVTPTPATAAA
jgi:hypothetical protein